MATVLARTATRSLRVSTRRWAPAALQLRCKSTARCVRLSRNKNADASQNAIPVSKSHLSALSLSARSLYDDDDDDLRFAGMSGGKLVHEALVECGVALSEQPPRRRPPGLVIFDSTGVAIQDVKMAELALDVLRSPAGKL